MVPLITTRNDPKQRLQSFAKIFSIEFLISVSIIKIAILIIYQGLLKVLMSLEVFPDFCLYPYVCDFLLVFIILCEK